MILHSTRDRVGPSGIEGAISSNLAICCAPGTSNLWSVRRDLVPMMANEQEVVGPLLQTAKVLLNGSVPAEDVPEYFCREPGHAQQRVASACEFYDGHLVLSDLFLQSPYGFEIDFASQPVP